MRQDEGRQYAKEQCEYIIACCACLGTVRFVRNRSDACLGKTILRSEYLLNQPFLESEALFITRSQQPTTGPYPGPPESSAQPRILLILRSILILSPCPCDGI